MCFLFSFLPATAYTVFGYFVLYCANQSEGRMNKFGKILAIWVFALAVLFLLMGAITSISGACPMEAVFEKMHSQG